MQRHFSKKIRQLLTASAISTGLILGSFGFAFAATTIGSDITLDAGGALKTGTTSGNTALLQAYDVGTTSYTTFGTLTADATDPTFNLAAGVTLGGVAIVDLTSAQTLTTKTIDGDDNTLQDIAVASLKDATDGELITWSTAGVATTIGVGTSGQVLQTNGAGAVPTWVTNSPGSGASTALDNLAAVAINTTLISDTANTDDLGSSSKEWRNLYLGETAGGTIFFGDDSATKIDLSAANTLTLTASSGVVASADLTATATLNAAGDTSAGDSAAIGYAAGDGIVITGQGTTNDITLRNDLDGAVLTVASGTTAVTFPGTIVVDDTTDSTSGTTGSVQTDGGFGAALDIFTDATLNAAGDTSAGDLAAIGYAAGDGIVITGQGSSNDITIKNDADGDVLWVLTGSTNVNIANSLFVTEQAAADTNVAGLGQLWVDLATPNILMFSDDAGTDFTVANTAMSLDSFAATTSLELLNTISNETGTGALVFANTPTLIAPVLGTPTSGTMTNVDGTAAGLTAGAVTGLTLASGSLTLSGADALTLTTTAATNVTLPTSGTLITDSVATLSSLVSVGTIATGTWQGTAVAVNKGGTGSTSAAAALTALSASSRALSNLASVAINTSLLSDGADTDDLGSVAKEWANLYIGDTGKAYFGLGQDASIHRNAANEMTLTASSGVTTSAGLTVGGVLAMGGNDISNGGVIFLTEQAAAEADVAGKGQLWVATASPNVLMFTDDAGNDRTVANLAEAQTFTNKTLTAPAIGTSILDTNGNELFLLTATGSAVNELTLANAATGNAPTVSASGGDTNINITLTPKGTGYVSVSNGGVQVVSQSVNPAADSGTGSTIEDGAIHVSVGAVTTNTDDWIVLPAVASVPDGHMITILCNAGGAFEIRTPAASNEKINTVDSDGDQEYAATDTEVVTFTKVSDADGWVATAQTALGAIATAVVPD